MSNFTTSQLTPPRRRVSQAKRLTATEPGSLSLSQNGGFRQRREVFNSLADPLGPARRRCRVAGQCVSDLPPKFLRLLAQGREVDHGTANEGRRDFKRSLSRRDGSQDVIVFTQLGRDYADVPVEDLQIPGAP